MPQSILDLTGKWEFKEYPLSARRMRDLDAADWHTTEVPSSIFNSLISAGQIEQHDIDAYPEKFAWVSEKPWVYRKTFDVSNELLQCDRVDLVFEGLDTIASIWLNDKLIGKTNNMFIPFRFDVTKSLKQQNNSLLVKFEPPAPYAKNLMDRYTSFSESDFSSPHRVYIRKAQYQFGWDFCPSLPGCGIWRPVRLEGIKKARLANVQAQTVDCNQNHADIKIAVKLDIVTKKSFLCNMTLSAGNKTIEHSLTFIHGEDFHSTVIRIEDALLWWPAGYGPQHLYDLELKLLSDGEIIDRKQEKIGIRTLRLNRCPDRHTKTFEFVVNDQPVFIKGANWIPASIFPGSVKADDYEKLLRTAAESNVNMLRVWGGGYYETEEFYQLCDQLGIMVWQDFMFACAYYPDRHWFLKEVKNEATTIIKLLRNHPCLTLWCGNNEIDQMHYTNRLGKGKKFYGKTIYHKLLPQLVAELAPGTDYIPTTPLGKKNDFKTGQTLTEHQWDVWSGHQPTHHYLCKPEDVPRFVTEFGMQSLPNIETVNSLCSSDNLRIGSKSVEKHNYQIDGNSRLYRYVGDLFGAPENLEHFVYLSQVTQARAAKAYIEHLRAHKSRNNGVLFWQFNDCCPAISWSAIDYCKQPKALYFYAKRFFAKWLLAIIPEFQQTKTCPSPRLLSISTVAINDSGQPLTGTLHCRLIDLFGNSLDHASFPVAIAPFSASTPLKLPKALALPSNPSKSALHLLIDNDGQKIAENLFFYLPDKYIEWPKVQIIKQLSQVAPRQWILKLKSNAIAKDVHITADTPIQFNDNFVDLIPPSEHLITINCEQQTNLLESTIQLRSVRPETGS